MIYKKVMAIVNYDRNVSEKFKYLIPKNCKRLIDFHIEYIRRAFPGVPVISPEFKEVIQLFLGVPGYELKTYFEQPRKDKNHKLWPLAEFIREHTQLKEKGAILKQLDLQVSPDPSSSTWKGCEILIRPDVATALGVKKNKTFTKSPLMRRYVDSVEKYTQMFINNYLHMVVGKNKNDSNVSSLNMQKLYNLRYYFDTVFSLHKDQIPYHVSSENKDFVKKEFHKDDQQVSQFFETLHAFEKKLCETFLKRGIALVMDLYINSLIEDPLHYQVLSSVFGGLAYSRGAFPNMESLSNADLQEDALLTRCVDRVEDYWKQTNITNFAYTSILDDFKLHTKDAEAVERALFVLRLTGKDVSTIQKARDLNDAYEKLFLAANTLARNTTGGFIKNIHSATEEYPQLYEVSTSLAAYFIPRMEAKALITRHENRENKRKLYKELIDKAPAVSGWQQRSEAFFKTFQVDFEKSRQADIKRKEIRQAAKTERREAYQSRKKIALANLDELLKEYEKNNVLDLFSGQDYDGMIDYIENAISKLKPFSNQSNKRISEWINFFEQKKSEVEKAQEDEYEKLSKLQKVKSELNVIFDNHASQTSESVNSLRRDLRNFADHDTVKDVIDVLYRPKNEGDTIYGDGGTAAGLRAEVEREIQLSDHGHYEKATYFFVRIEGLLRYHTGELSDKDTVVLQHLYTDLDKAIDLYLEKRKALNNKKV